MVCGLEPTGTYHQAVATFLERQGAVVLLLSSSVAYWNRRTREGTCVNLGDVNLGDVAMFVTLCRGTRTRKSRVTK